MIHRLFAYVVFLLALAAGGSHAYLIAQNMSGIKGKANLMVSHMTVRVGAQWLDIEEEAEVEIVTTSGSARGPWILEGTFSVPKGTAITGCMLWNNDTLLMGKLRGKADAQHIFDSLVPPRDSGWARDPLLVEQMTDTTYGLHLFPFQTSGTRRFRLRYLVPLAPGANELSIRPLMATHLTGTLPAQFRLRLRGKAEGVKVVRGSLAWPAEFPSYQLVDLDATTDVRLRWPAGPAGDGTCAIRGRIDSGAWKGEFALFTGKIPDSILQKTALRSETVVLWRWIEPRTFFDVCYDPVSGTNTGRCPNAHGQLAIQQAGVLGDIARRSVENAGKIGLVVDEGMEDTSLVFPLTDSTTTNYRNLRKWLSSVTPEYLKWRIPPATNLSGSGQVNLDISRNRTRFRTDVLKVGAMYSAASGVLRHFLIVTVGPTPVTGDFLSMPDLSALPPDVTVASSRLVSPGSGLISRNGGLMVGMLAPPVAPWPGVDIDGAVLSRPWGDNVVQWNDIPLTRTRELLAGRLTLRSGDIDLSRDIVVRSNGRGGFNTSLNAHGPILGEAITWSLYDKNGDSLTSWSETPTWLRVDGDSVMPRLWGRSDAPLSPIFEDKELSTVFGYVDRFYSLLATPSDTVGLVRQKAYRDSGVPFLTWADIFPRQGYGSEAPTGVSSRPAIARFLVSWARSSHTLRVDLAGLGARGLEIRDFRGRLVASFGASQLEGLKILDWVAPASLGRGMLLVSVRTASGLRTAKVVID